MRRSFLMLLGLVVALQASAFAADPYGLDTGKVELKSIGTIEFGPAGVLFVADPDRKSVV